MRDGRLISERFPYLLISFEVRQREASVEALLDTGFDGDLLVPADLIADGETPDGYLNWTLADGSVVRAPVYFGTVRVGEMAPIAVSVTALGEETLLGVGVASHFSIVLDHGRRVIVES